MTKVRLCHFLMHLQCNPSQSQLSFRDKCACLPTRSLIVFFAIYSGIVNNQNFSRYVRFNALQSILLDIILMCAPYFPLPSHVMPYKGAAMRCAWLPTEQVCQHVFKRSTCSTATGNMSFRERYLLGRHWLRALAMLSIFTRCAVSAVQRAGPD